MQNVFGVCLNPGRQLSTVVVTEITSFVSLAESMVYSVKNDTKDPNV